MSIKDNFYQAVKEMLNTGGLVGADLEEKARTESELDSYLEETPAVPPRAAAPVQEPAEPPRQEAPPRPVYPMEAAPAPAPIARESTPPAAPEEMAYSRPTYSSERSYSGAYSASSGSFGQSVPPSVPPTPPYRPIIPQDPPSQPSYEPSSEMTIISKNTLVDGNIRSFASISIDGNVRGDVNVVKDAYISGKMIGELKCNNVAMQGSSVQGDVVSKGQVIIDNNSLLLGNMSAQYAHIDGKVKGNMEVSGKVEFKSDAVVIGDVKTSSLTVMDGANIQGFINTTYLLENPDRFFPGQISIDEEEMAH